MQAALEACESYRFYSSSLLVIYDGELPCSRRSTEDRLSDEEGEEEEEEEEEEQGAFGFPHSTGGASASSSSGASSGANSSSGNSRPVVDVRMIDFAHTTCRHYREDSVVHEGQDSGYIFGLQNLITIISQLEEHGADWTGHFACNIETHKNNTNIQPDCKLWN